MILPMSLQVSPTRIRFAEARRRPSVRVMFERADGHGTAEHDRLRAGKRGAERDGNRVGSQIRQREGPRGAPAPAARVRANRAAGAPGGAEAVFARQCAGDAHRRACRPADAARRQRGIPESSGRAGRPPGRAVRRRAGQCRRPAGAARRAGRARDHSRPTRCAPPPTRSSLSPSMRRLPASNRRVATRVLRSRRSCAAISTASRH